MFTAVNATQWYSMLHVHLLHQMPKWWCWRESCHNPPNHKASTIYGIIYCRKLKIGREQLSLHGIFANFDQNINISEHWESLSILLCLSQLLQHHTLMYFASSFPAQARGKTGSPLRADSVLSPSNQETFEAVLARLQADPNILEVWIDKFREWLSAEIMKPLVKHVQSAHLVSRFFLNVTWSQCRQTFLPKILFYRCLTSYKTQQDFWHRSIKIDLQSGLSIRRCVAFLPSWVVHG